MKKTIEITIPPGGGLTIEGAGFAGKQCLDASAAFEKALAGTIKGRIEKAEMRRARLVPKNTTSVKRG